MTKDYVTLNDKLTLSDFCGLEIFTRPNGTISICIGEIDGHKVGIIGHNASKGLTDFEIYEEAYSYYMALVEEIKK